MKLDYEKLGFKAGIEIHQELNTGKLFCDCSSDMEEKELISETTRKLKASAGETGEVDLASQYEHFRDRSFFYHGYKGEFCLVELDEEPPHAVNKGAFMLGLGVAKLLKLNVPESVCVMRKTVTDGSAVSGFQRTMLLGYESYESFLDTSKGKVKIEQLNLEEDSSKIEKKEGNKVFYSLSRLGVPLLEIGTDASLKNPQHVKETALAIGTLLRSFNVKRGIGTIRQDVNISINEGARIEVKGWQDLKKLELLVENEVLRQYNLLEIKKELAKRKTKKFSKKTEDVTDLLKNSDSRVISSIIKDGGSVIAMLLPNFSGLLKKELCPEKTFGKELAEYAMAYGTKGMIHTDEDLSKYNLKKEFEELKRLFKAKKNDLILVIAEKKEIAEKAVDAVYERALYALNGVPEETRIPNHHNATNSYARPLPGANRLYPETDIPNIDAIEDLIVSIELPELIPEKINKLEKKYKISKQLAKEIIEEGIDFDKYVKKYKNIEADFIARTLIEFPKEIKKRYDKEIAVEKNVPILFEKLNKNELTNEAVFEILVEIAHDKKPDYDNYKPLTGKALENEIRNIIKENKNLPENAIIGKVMGKLRGRAPGKEIMAIIKKQHK